MGAAGEKVRLGERERGSKRLVGESGWEAYREGPRADCPPGLLPTPRLISTHPAPPRACPPSRAVRASENSETPWRWSVPRSVLGILLAPASVGQAGNAGSRDALLPRGGSLPHSASQGQGGVPQQAAPGGAHLCPRTAGRRLWGDRVARVRGEPPLGAGPQCQRVRGVSQPPPPTHSVLGLSLRPSCSPAHCLPATKAAGLPSSPCRHLLGTCCVPGPGLTLGPALRLHTSPGGGRQVSR